MAYHVQEHAIVKWYRRFNQVDVAGHVPTIRALALDVNSACGRRDLSRVRGDEESANRTELRASVRSEGGPNMKNSSKKALEKRGIISAGRAVATPGAQAHADKRRANRKTDKQRLKREVQLETARNRGPFPFAGRSFSANRWASRRTNRSGAVGRIVGGAVVRSFLPRAR